MDTFPVLVMLACVCRRKRIDSESATLRFGADLIASLFAGLGISLISGGLSAGMGILFAFVCTVDLFQHKFVGKSFIEHETVAFLPTILLAVAGVYYAARTANNSSLIWPTIAMFIAAALRAIYPIRIIGHHLH